jgi:hypothetical protein
VGKLSFTIKMSHHYLFDDNFTDANESLSETNTNKDLPAETIADFLLKSILILEKEFKIIKNYKEIFA